MNDPMVLPSLQRDLDWETLCCVPGCNGKPHETAPFPMCGTHIKEIYLYGQSVVDERWTEALIDSTEATETITPATATACAVESWVYFVRVGDLIKIGYSTYPRARFKTLKVDEVLAVLPGTRTDERRCHEAFAHLRQHGEYFQAGTDLLRFIADVAA